MPADISLPLVRKVYEKRKKEEDGDLRYILLPTWLLFMVPAATAPIIHSAGSRHIYLY